MKIKKMLMCIIVISAIVFLFLLIKPVKNDYVSVLLDKESEIKPSECILPKKVYKQSFISDVDQLNKIGIVFSTYFHENKGGLLNVKVYDYKNRIIYDGDIKTEDIIDNDEFIINFKKQNKSNNKKYFIEFSYKNYNKDCLAYWYANNGSKNDNLTINDKPVDEVISINVYGKKTYIFAYWYPLIVSAICISIYSCLGDYKNEKNTK